MEEEEIQEAEIVTEVKEAVAEMGSEDEQALARRLEEADALTEGEEASPFPTGPRHEYVVLRLNQLRATINDSFLEMAGLLCETSEHGHWSAAGYDNFADFISATVGMKYRTARYLMVVHQTFVERLNVPRPLLMEVGWTKLKEISGVATEENVDEWIETARNNRTSQLIQMVRQQRTEETVEEYSTLSIGCYAPEKRTIQAAIEDASRVTQSDRPGHNLALICADYSAGARRDAEAVSDESPDIASVSGPLHDNPEEELPRGEALPDGPSVAEIVDDAPDESLETEMIREVEGSKI